jgi:hypothetical protein
MRIPKVSEWLVRVGGAWPNRYVVKAPTRILARLNLRAAGIYAPIVTLGPVRRARGYSQIVTREDS